MKKKEQNLDVIQSKNVGLFAQSRKATQTFKVTVNEAPKAGILETTSSNWLTLQLCVTVGASLGPRAGFFALCSH